MRENHLIRPIKHDLYYNATYYITRKNEHAKLRALVHLCCVGRIQNKAKYITQYSI